MPMFVRLSSCVVLMCSLVAGAAWAGEPPLWFAADRPIPEARQAVEVLLDAATHGLAPSDYQAAALASRLAQAQDGPALTPTAQAQLDAALSTALQRYLIDVQAGRLDPRSIHADFTVQRPPPLDTEGYLREAVASRRVAEALRQAEPRVPMYASLRRALARYRALAAHPAWQAPLPRLPGRKLEPGRPWDGLPQLAERLVALGDLAVGAPIPAQLDGALLAAVQGFQERHGLTPDGVLGVATLRELNVTPAARVRQIELTLERLRWTPLLLGPRMIVVNVPEFMLRAYEVREGRIDIKLSMKVIVGKALDTRTPLFDEDMRFIEFSPYWNVPPSIARKELVPKLRRSPGYFDDQGFEFVTGGGQVVTHLSGGMLDAVLAGQARIRQRPGPKNALGDIKFVFPNNDNIYLHHTPSPQLFARDRRDFSHGCIRVEEPVALAQFVLQNQPEWTEERIREAMEQGESHTIRLKTPLPVLITYSTVLVKGGRVYFYPDLYKHDQLLERALRERPRPGIPGLPTGIQAG